MKALPFVLSVIALGVAALALAAALSARDGDVDELRARIAELEHASPKRTGPTPEQKQHPTDRPRRVHTREPGAPSDPPVEPAPPPVVRPPVSPATSRAGNAGGNAQSFLTGWVQSFEDDEKGSEFFRLAVEAYAPELVADLRGYLADARQPTALRLAVAKMLTTPRFRDDPTAIDALVDALQTSPKGDLAKTIVDGIAAGGGPRHAARLEALVHGTSDRAARLALIIGVAKTAGDQRNAAMLRLYERERDEGLRAQIVGQVDTLDVDSALELIRRASGEDHYPIRNRAAERLGHIRTDHARAMLDEWMAREKEAAVTARLRAARAVQDQIPHYDVRRVLGPPDVPNPAGDHMNAWCPKEQNAGTEWLELTYDDAIAATHVRVYEVYTGGAVAKIEVRSPGGGWRVGWQGTAEKRAGSAFEVELDDPGVAIDAVRVTFDTARHDGWHEVDAVELVHAGGSAYATGATASSTWGQ